MTPQKGHSLPTLLFTPETITLTEEALKLIEEPLQRADHQDTKVLFAAATMKRIKGELTRMKQSAGLMCLTSFDYNEKVLMIQTLREYSRLLASLPVTDRQAREIRQCQRIAAYFEAENTRAERNHPERGKAANTHFPTDA
jgi:hypothetical protein